jgi:four helix bundle protein
MLDQMKRSALSTQLNLAEGYAFGRGPRCRHHWRIAYGSSVETTEVLELLRELGDLDDEEMVGQSKRVQALTLRLWLRSTD